mgnify:CR=1 FL=1
MTSSRDITVLLEIMAKLRTPVTGCPWEVQCAFWPRPQVGVTPPYAMNNL